jgi:hypothetical protein
VVVVDDVPPTAVDDVVELVLAVDVVGARLDELDVDVELVVEFDVEVEDDVAPPGIVKTGDSSDVLPSSSVAVAVRNAPGVIATPNGITNSTWPSSSVMTIAVPSGLSASPLPDGSASAHSKSSTRYCVFGAAASVPWNSIVSPMSTTPVTSGKFCKWFAPSSSSWTSFGVTPSASRSIASPPVREDAVLPDVDAGRRDDHALVRGEAGQNDDAGAVVVGDDVPDTRAADLRAHRRP